MGKSLILLFVLMSSLFISGCQNTNSSSVGEKVDFRGIAGKSILYKKDDNVFLNEKVILSGNSYKPSTFDDVKSTLKSIDKKGNYVVVEEQPDKKIGSKKLITNFGIFEANFPRFEGDKFANYYLYGKNIAYYKCEKLMYFSDSNTNDCLANQILVNDKVVDQIDMGFFDKNRKYLFAIRYLDDDKMIYVKGLKYYIYSLKDNKTQEYTKLNDIRYQAINKAIKENYISEKDLDSAQYFDFIGYDKDGKIVTTEEKFGDIYSDIIVDKVRREMIAEGITPEDYIFPNNEYAVYDLESLSSRIDYPAIYQEEDEKSMQIPPYVRIYDLDKVQNDGPSDFYDVYVGGVLYAENTIVPKVVSGNIIYATYRNIGFEEANPKYFELPQKTMVQYMNGATKKYVQYGIYKNKELLSTVDYRSNSVIAPRLIYNDIDNNLCRMTLDGSSISIELCIQGKNVLAKTYYPDASYSGLNDQVIVYNNLKVDFGKYLTTGTNNLLKDSIVISPYEYYHQFVFEQEKLDGILFVSPKLSEQKINDIKMLFGGNESDEKKVRKYLASRLNVKTEILEAIDSGDISEEEYTPEQKNVMKKLESLTDSIQLDNSLFYAKYDAENSSFKNNSLVIGSMNELLGMY